MKLLEHMPVTPASQASTEKVLSEDVLEGGDRGREGGGKDRRKEERKGKREEGREGGWEEGRKRGSNGEEGCAQ